MALHAHRSLIKHIVVIDWFPNHLLIVHVCLLFVILNPLVIPFALIYFAVEMGACYVILTGYFAY